MNDNQTHLLRQIRKLHTKVAPSTVHLNRMIDEAPPAEFMARTQQAQVIEREVSKVKVLLPKMEQLIDSLGNEASDNQAVQELQSEFDSYFDFLLSTQQVVGQAESQAAAYIRPPPPQVTTSSSQSAGNNPSSRMPNVAKLPKQQLPYFDGDVMKFRTFWQQFEAAVDRNPMLSPVQKLNYLLPQLKDEAKKAVEGLDVDDDSYAIAVRILKDRYGDTAHISRSYYRRLERMPTCSDDFNDLVGFLNELEAICRSLKSIGTPPTAEHIASIVFARLPERVCGSMESSRMTSSPWTTDDLLEKLQHEVKMKRIASEGRATPLLSGATENESRFATGEALVANRRVGTNQDRPSWFRPLARQASQPQDIRRESTGRFAQQSVSNYDKQCQFCNRVNDHYSTECKRFKTPDERKSQALKLRLCLNCLRPDHMVRYCTSTKTCFCCRRSGHHTALCRYGQRPNTAARSWMGQRPTTNGTRTLVADGNSENEYEDSQEPDKAEVKFTSLATNAVDKRRVTLLQSAQATAINGRQQASVRVLLDSCSNRTFITAKLADRLGVQQTPGRPLEVNVFGSEQAKTLPTKTARISILLQDRSTMSMDVTVLPLITGKYKREAIDCTSLKKLTQRMKLADKLPESQETFEVDMLIGNDYYADIVLGERTQVDEGLYVIRSKLGWVLAGRASSSTLTTEDHVMTGVTLKCSVSCPMPQESFAANAHPYLPKPPLSDLWSLDTLGIKDEPTEKEKEDEEALAQFKNSIRLENGRYIARFPWIEEKVDQLPDNYSTAFVRLKSLMKRLRGRPELLRKYDSIIKEQLQSGITEAVDTCKSSEQGNVVNYLPHREIEKPDKETTKVRIVYDASARQTKDSLSLNDCMRRGPVFLEDLSGILLRLRLHPVALVADIEKAFHQVVLDERDRDATRFLWLKDHNGEVTDNNILVLRFQRVLFGAKASPMLLEGTVDHHLTKKQSPVCESINGNIYMDNLVTGVETTEKALAFYDETKSVFQEIGMNMREWASNCHEFIAKIPTKDRSKPKTMKILGIVWKTGTDEFCFDIPKKSLTEVETKRDLVSAVSAVFDPNGLILPLTLKGKVLLQKVDREVHRWDKPVPEELQKEFQQFLTQLKQLPETFIPRYIPLTSLDGARYQLHCFSDASDKCFATAVYLRTQKESEVSVQLIFAKGRVNPVRKLTIPRLELMGVLIGVRALKYVQKEIRLNVDASYLWSDSSCVLQWLRSMRNLGRFVNNRVKEIRQSAGIEFRYVPSKDNVADIPTRTMEMSIIPPTWFSGPKWLWSAECDWPEIHLPELSANDPETCKNPPLEQGSVPVPEATACPVNLAEVPRSPFGISTKRFPSFSKLLRVTAWCLRFVRRVQTPDLKVPKWITAKELASAETLWLKAEQQRLMEEFKNGANQYQSFAKKLGVFEDNDGLVRCKGRFGNSCLPYTAKYPVLLPKHGHITELIVLRAHEQVMHGGTAHTLGKIRNQYWLIGGRGIVRSAIRRCVVCRRYEGHPFRMQNMPDLPKDRTTPGIAFQQVGLDYFGPLFVKNENTTKKKVWCALFVCMKVRAVHIELVEDMATASFLLALRRFIARYGKPATITSDHASQFELADSVLQKLWTAVEQDEDIQNYSSAEGIQWRKITEYAPWQGGVYERLVKTVKRPLRKVLHQQLLTADQLRTILHEVAAVVNSRPLLSVPASDDEFAVTDVLTPSHFLLPNPKPGIQVTNEPALTPANLKQSLIQSWKKGIRLLDAYWQAWRTIYLANLREQHSLHHKQSKNAVQRSPQIGEIVVIQEPNQKRGVWKFGLIESLVESSDGKVRSAKVVLPSKNVLQRAVNHLYPLECNAFPNIHPSSTPKVKTLPRKAALKARQKLKQQLRAS